MEVSGFFSALDWQVALFKYCTLCLPPGSLYLLVPGRVHRADQVTEVFPSQADTRLGIHLPCQGLDKRDMIKKMMLFSYCWLLIPWTLLLSPCVVDPLVTKFLEGFLLLSASYSGFESLRFRMESVTNPRT